MERGSPKKISPEVSTFEEKATVPKNTNIGADLVSGSANLSTNKVDMHDENKNAPCKRVVWNPNVEVLFFESFPSSTKMPRNRVMGSPFRRSRRLQNAAPSLHADADRLTREVTVIMSGDEDERANDVDTSLEDRLPRNRTMGSPVRRSRRLQNAASHLHMDVDSLTQEVTVIMSNDKDERANDVDASLEDKNLEEQVQYLLGVFKKQHDILNALKSKTTNGGHSGSSSTEEVTYKSLYINSQVKMEDLVEENNLLRKKTDALLEENHQLDKKLEHALGKIEVFEKGAHVSSHVLEKLKGVLCSIRKGSGAAANILSEL